MTGSKDRTTSGRTPARHPGAALVTGTTSGIGEATARALHRAGFTVYATGRDVDRLRGLASAGLRTLALDVTDEESMREAVSVVEDAHGHLDLLVNNAGYALYGPVETLPMSEFRRQFETNVFGLVRMSQLVLPGMRQAGRGRIVNVGSMGGRFTFPGGGAYHATKHAVEALSDALRLEVAPFGVRVVLVEPGPVRTEYLANVASPEVPDGPYRRFVEQMNRRNAEAYEVGPLARLVSDAGDVARVVVHAATTSRPRPRYAVGPYARALITGRRLLPDQAWDAMVRSQYPTPEA